MRQLPSNLLLAQMREAAECGFDQAKVDSVNVSSASLRPRETSKCSESMSKVDSNKGEEGLDVNQVCRK
jgi:hypothetical protein